MKNVHCISTKQHQGMKSGILWSKNSTISQVVYAVFLEAAKVKLSQQVCESRDVVSVETSRSRDVLTSRLSFVLVSEQYVSVSAK